MIIIEYLIILLLATYFLYFFTKNNHKLGTFFHVLDLPKKGKLHENITPLIGSFPFFIISITLLIYFNVIFYNKIFFYIFLYSYLFFFIGYIDDRYSLNAYLKLGISLIIVLIALNSFESLTISKIYIQTFNKYFYFDEFKLYFSTLCILLLMNALNLTDGINGLASGFTSCWILSLALITNDEIVFKILLLLSIFSLLNTFIILNGKYFLGDSGTLFLGSLVGILTIFIYNNQLNLGNSISVEQIFIFFMIPGVDMFRLFLTRLLKKKDPFKGDLNHLHHLMLRQFSLNKTLLIYLIVFLITNLFSYFNIIYPSLIIILYLAIYIFFVFSSKKKLENTSK